MPKIEQALPPFLQIVRHISGQIASGQLRAGDRIPSQRELMDEWAVSKATANKVVATLKADGLIETAVGLGSRVNAHPSDVPSGVGLRDMFGRMTQHVRIRLANERSEIRSTSVVIGYEAPPLVREALGLAPDGGLLRRRRVIFRDDRPYCTAVSWFSHALIGQFGRHLADRLLEHETVPEGTPQLVARAFDRELTHATDTAEAVTADPVVAEELRITPGSPLLRVTSTVYSQDWPIECIEYSYVSGACTSWTYVLG